jgi:hypothetical protein
MRINRKVRKERKEGVNHETHEIHEMKSCQPLFVYFGGSLQFYKFMTIPFGQVRQT